VLTGDFFFFFYFFFYFIFFFFFFLLQRHSSAPNSTRLAPQPLNGLGISVKDPRGILFSALFSARRPRRLSR
jgi:hypothetical protein